MKKNINLLIEIIMNRFIDLLIDLFRAICFIVGIFWLRVFFFMLGISLISSSDAEPTSWINGLGILLMLISFSPISWIRVFIRVFFFIAGLFILLMSSSPISWIHGLGILLMLIGCWPYLKRLFS
jgi:hypothetical protein